MFVTYDPEDGSEPTTWDFDPEDVSRKDGQAIEKAMGGDSASFDRWLDMVRAGNLTARTVLLWHLLKEKHPHLQFKDAPNFKKRQLQVQMSVAELRALKDQISRTKMDENTREVFEAAFDRDIRDAMERETGVVEGEIEPLGKAN